MNPQLINQSLSYFARDKPESNLAAFLCIQNFNNFQKTLDVKGPTAMLQSLTGPLASPLQGKKNAKNHTHLSFPVVARETGWKKRSWGET